MNEIRSHSKKKNREKHDSWSHRYAYYCPIKFIDKMILQAYIQIDTRLRYYSPNEKSDHAAKLLIVFLIRVPTWHSSLLLSPTVQCKGVLPYDNTFELVFVVFKIAYFVINTKQSWGKGEILIEYRFSFSKGDNE